MNDIKKNDYVLATKYTDGHPNDPWCVGFYRHMFKDRYCVVDKSGNTFRLTGYGRIKKISYERGNFLLKMSNEIEICSRSLWWWSKCNMSIAKDLGIVLL